MLFAYCCPLLDQTWCRYILCRSGTKPYEYLKLQLPSWQHSSQCWYHFVLVDYSCPPGFGFRAVTRCWVCHLPSPNYRSSIQLREKACYSSRWYWLMAEAVSRNHTYTRDSRQPLPHLALIENNELIYDPAQSQHYHEHKTYLPPRE